MTDRSLHRLRRRRGLALVCAGVILGLAPVVGALPSGASITASDSSNQTVHASSADSETTDLTLAAWKQRYEHDVGILADDVLVVVDDGKRAQTHVTTAKVKTTVNDCRTWASDAARARTAAPPIPLAGAEKAWKSMVGASALAAADCLASLQQGSRRSAKDFQKQLQVVEKDEVTLTSDLNG
jgi:hypothetical protein